MLLGQVIRGGCVSWTVTVKLHLLLLPTPSVAVQLTVVLPSGKKLPAGTRIWSKSGDAYDYHHLVARAVLPNGSDFVIAAFTKGVRTVPGVIPRIYEKVGSLLVAAPAVR